jgi:hypothetical protein
VSSWPVCGALDEVLLDSMGQEVAEAVHLAPGRGCQSGFEKVGMDATRIDERNSLYPGTRGVLFRTTGLAGDAGHVRLSATGGL